MTNWEGTLTFKSFKGKKLILLLGIRFTKSVIKGVYNITKDFYLT